jgi:uncharacterized RDD family membrane protein YckC
MTTDALPPRYASFNNRAIASAIDLCLLMLVAAPVSEYLSEHMFDPINADALMTIMPAATDVQIAAEEHVLEQIILKNLPQFIVMNLLQIAFIALYMLPFWFRYSTTPGKMLFRLEIRDATNGERMTRRQSVRRFLGYIVSALPLTLGFIWVLFNRKKQGWHDLIANTVVIVKPRK